MRTFIISNRPYLGAIGGSSGVNYRMLVANNSYKIIDNAYSIFSDVDICHNDLLPVISKNPAAVANKNKLTNIIKNIDFIGLSFIFNHKSKLKNYYKRIEKLNNKYHFSQEDCFIFHDVESAYCFCKKFHINKTLLVYHQQGGLYQEWSSFSGRHKAVYKRYMFNFMGATFGIVKTVGFPSLGAKEMLIDSDSHYDNLLSKKEIGIFYNGIDTSLTKENDKDSFNYIAEINRRSGVKFATVAALNEAKGVERIPQFLGKLKKENINFVWVLVGTGIKSKEVLDEIKVNDIEQNVIWINKAIPHNCIMDIFSATDFYIMFHRASIFDYTTLEAMSCRNIPILSNIGGNKEVILQSNGLLIDDFSDVDEFLELLNNNSIEKLKELNREIVCNNFSYETFLNSYLKWINCLQ